MSRVKAGVLHKVCALPNCGKSFDTPDKANYREKRYCSRTCSNRATTFRRAEAIRAAKRYQPPICPCGKEVPPPPGQQYIYKEQKKYCSAECRQRYGVKRQKDPANWVTFTCLNCQQEFTLPRSYTSVGKYCSNECAARHTRTKQHIVVEDAVVLDSGYEALFWGLCSLWKIPVERADRSQAISFTKDIRAITEADDIAAYDLIDTLGSDEVSGTTVCWYCPDFRIIIPHLELDLWVEVKGFEDNDDRARYAAWRKAGHDLAVVGRDELSALREADRPAQFVARLKHSAKLSASSD